MKKFLLATYLSSLLSTQLLAFHFNQDEVDTYFNSLAKQFFGEQAISTYPALNIYQHKDYYLVEVEAVGLDKSNIEVSISDDNELIISGKKDKASHLQNLQIIHEESFFGEFKRVISLPKDADNSKIDVTYKDGILKVQIARNTTQHGKRIIPIN